VKATKVISINLVAVIARSVTTKQSKKLFWRLLHPDLIGIRNDNKEIKKANYYGSPFCLNLFVILSLSKDEGHTSTSSV